MNKHCDDFKLAELTPDHLKCLIFVQGLVSAKDSEMRKRMLSKLQNDPGLTLQKLSEDCQKCLSIEKDSKNIEESGVAHIRKLNKSLRFSPSPERKQKFYNNGKSTTYRANNDKNLSKYKPLPHLHVIDVENYTGIRIVVLNIKNV